MKDLKNKMMGSSAISAILFVILGTLLIIFPQKMANIICYGIGLVVLLYGIILILKYLGDKDRKSVITTDIVIGVILCGVALFMFLSQALLSIIALIFGLFLVIDGILNAQKAFNLKNLGYEKWWIDFLFSAISMAAGLLLIIKSSVIPEFLLGICLLYDGIMNLTSVYGFRKITKLNRKRLNAHDDDYNTIDEKDL